MYCNMGPCGYLKLLNMNQLQKKVSATVVALAPPTPLTPTTVLYISVDWFVLISIDDVYVTLLFGRSFIILF